MRVLVSQDFMLFDQKDSLTGLESDEFVLIDDFSRISNQPINLAEKIVYVPKEISTREMLNVIHFKKAQSVIQPFRPDVLLRDIRSWIQLRKDSTTYFRDPAKVLLPEPLESAEFSFCPGLDSKETLRNRVETFLAPFANSSAQASVSAVFEELYMNAVIDAPRESKTESQQQIKIDVILGVDAHSLLLGIRDYYGSLEPQKVIDRMTKVADLGKFSSMSFSPATGAGIGTTILLENSSHVFFGGMKGQISLVCSLIPRKLNNRDRQSYPRSMHFIFEQSLEGVKYV